MIKQTVKWFSLSISFLFLILIFCYGLLFTPFATPLINVLINLDGKNNIEIGNVEYLFPQKFTFYDIRFINSDLQPQHKSMPNHQINLHHIPKLSIWLNPSVIYQGKIVIDTLYAEGISLNEIQMKKEGINENNKQLQRLQRMVLLHSLVLKDAFWTSKHLSIPSLNAQIINKDSSQTFGTQSDIQISIPNLTYGDIHLTDTLITGNQSKDLIQLYTASFHWHDAQISTQASLKNKQLNLSNLTATNLTLDQKKITELLFTNQLIEQQVKVSVEKFDLLNTQINLGDVSLNGLDLSGEQWQLNQHLWQQNSKVSFHLDLANIKPLTLTDLTGEVNFTPRQASISQFSTNLLGGSLSATGKITQAGTELQTLTIENIKWLDKVETLPQILSMFDTKPLSIERLSINNAQLIQVDKAPFWQISGLNLIGKDLQWSSTPSINKDNALATSVYLQQGSLQISADNASYQQILTEQPIASISANNGELSLERLVLPLTLGIINGVGQYQPLSQNKLWQLRLNGNAVELASLNHFAFLPAHLEGLTDFSLLMTGNENHLIDTITGKIHLYQAFASLTESKEDKRQTQNTKALSNSDSVRQKWPISIDEMKIHFNKGKLSIPLTPLSEIVKENANIYAQWDLSKEFISAEDKFELHYQQECCVTQLDLLRGNVKQLDLAKPNCLKQ